MKTRERENERSRDQDSRADLLSISHSLDLSLSDFSAAPLVATHPDDLALIDAIAEVARATKARDQAEHAVNLARHWGEDLRPHEYALTLARHHLHEARVHLTQLEIRFGIQTTKGTKNTKVVGRSSASTCGTGTPAGDFPSCPSCSSVK